MASSVEACVNNAMRAGVAVRTFSELTELLERSSMFGFLGIHIAAAEPVKNQISDFLATLQMFHHHTFDGSSIDATVPDAFRIDHYHRRLRLAGHHAMGAGTLDAQFGARIDLFAQHGEHGFGQHAIFGAAWTGAHEHMPVVGSHDYSLAKMPMRPTQKLFSGSGDGSAWWLRTAGFRQISCRSIRSGRPAPARIRRWPMPWHG